MALSFEKATDPRRNAWAASNTISMMQTQFPDGTKFKVTGWDTLERKVDGKLVSGANVCPVFLTTAGNLFLSKLRKSRYNGGYDVDGNFHEPSGTFVELVRGTIQKYNGREDVTNDVILNEVVTAVKDKDILVKSETFMSYEDHKPATIFSFDVVGAPAAAPAADAPAAPRARRR
jgi:hypothetical protein